MEFTTIENVKSLFRRLKIEADTGDEKTNTVVTEEEVEQFIDETELIIKTHISRCYSVENIGAESKKILGVVTKYMVAHTIQGILSTSKAGNQKDQQLSDNGWQEKAKTLLENICPDGYCECNKQPVVLLPDTPLSPVNKPIDASSISSSVNIAQFQKGKDNW